MKSISHLYKKKGISLIEMMVYIAVLMVVMIVVLNSVLHMAASYNRIRITADMERSASVLLGRIAYEVRSAERVHVSQSILATSSGVLFLEKGTEPLLENVEIRKASTTVHLFKNGVFEGPLTTTAGVQIESLTFYLVSTPVSEGVTVQALMRGVRGEDEFTRMYQTTAILKGSY
jgi:hypothetical protein